jgi:hypothetical protein
MPTLFVCHSAGDTNVISATAEIMLRRSRDTLKFLIIGKAAEDKLRVMTEDHPFKRNPAQVELIYLSEIIGKEAALALENGTLTPEQLDLIKPRLAGINRAVIGTPSQTNCTVPFQIAAYLADTLQQGLTYNDYLFEEKGHVYWKTLAEPASWQQKYTWLLPLPYATEIARRLNPALKIETVGHPSIDAAISAPIDAASIAHTRSELQIPESQTLLFISGTKDLAQDQSLLAALYEVIASDAKYDNIAIRIGIHPGASDLSSYVDSLQKQIPAMLRSRVRLIISDRLASTCAAMLQPEVCVLKNISGDQAAQAADAVACAVPATLVNTAAIQGKPSFYLQDQAPFIQGRLLAGKVNTHPFLDQIIGPKVVKSVTKAELGLPAPDAAEIITEMLNKP